MSAIGWENAGGIQKWQGLDPAERARQEQRTLKAVNDLLAPLTLRTFPDVAVVVLTGIAIPGRPQTFADLPYDIADAAAEAAIWKRMQARQRGEPLPEPVLDLWSRHIAGAIRQRAEQEQAWLAGGLAMPLPRQPNTGTVDYDREEALLRRCLAPLVLTRQRRPLSAAASGAGGADHKLTGTPSRKTNRVQHSIWPALKLITGAVAAGKGDAITFRPPSRRLSIPE